MKVLMSFLSAAIFSATVLASGNQPVSSSNGATSCSGISLATQAKVYVFSAESLIDGLLVKFENDAQYYACRDVEAILEINSAFASANEELMKEIVNIGGQWTVNNLGMANVKLAEISDLCKVATSGFSKAEKQAVIEKVISIQSDMSLETLGGF